MTGLEARKTRRRSGPRVLLCVTGGIAAYKALELVRLMRKAGWDVVVAMTRAGTKFVGPESFRALTGNPVALELFPKVRPPAKSATGNRQPAITHVDLATSADLVVVAPATANVIGKLAAGVADDLVSTMLLAVPEQTRRAGRALIAPAMNVNMWQHPSVQANMKKLAEFGYRFVEPESGELACGTRGAGRLADIRVIFDRCRAALRGPGPELAGVRVLVTTGRTEEHLDPVRVITNRSTGLMGAEIAASFLGTGASVALVAGEVSVELPPGAETTRVRTTEEMLGAVRRELPRTDILVMCAAVADFRPVQTSRTKRSDQTLSLRLERTPDILTEVSRTTHHAFVVGFSLDDEPARAREKLAAKRLDMIVANPLTTPGAPVTRPRLYFRHGRSRAPGEMLKSEFAALLVTEIARQYRRRSR